MLASVFIVAVENSGDQLGAALISSLKKTRTDIDIKGIGGSLMEAEGLRSEVDIFGLSVLGFAEALRVYGLVLKRVRETVALIIQSDADAVVLIDSWGFMIRVAKALKKAGYKGKIVKYVAPQVWAMREGRAKVLADNVDYLLCLHSFDPPYFTRHGLDVRHVGNPVLDQDYSKGDAEFIRNKYGLESDKRTIGIFFGSRNNEVERLGEVFLRTAKHLKATYNNVQFISPVANSIRNNLENLTGNQSLGITLIEQADLIDSFAAMDVALACSGTITSQLAAAGVPTIVAYKLSPATYHIAKHIFKPEYISLVNIAANTDLMPEYVQSTVTTRNLTASIQIFLDDENFRKCRGQALIEQASLMKAKGGSASERAASAIIDIIGT